MALFDLVNFNGEVFDAAVRETPNLRMNELLHSGAIVERGEYASLLPDQKGGNYTTSLISLLPLFFPVIGIFFRIIQVILQIIVQIILHTL